MNNVLERIADTSIIVDLSLIKNFSEAQPIIKQLAPHAYFRLGLACVMGSLNTIRLTAEACSAKFFYDININTDPEQMDLLGSILKYSGAAMISVHCSSGIESVQSFVKQMRAGTRPFKEDWELEKEAQLESAAAIKREEHVREKIAAEPNEDEKLKIRRDADTENEIERKTKIEKMKLPMRPLIFAVTIPSCFEPSTAAQSFGDYHDRMRVFNGLIARDLFDGVICSPKNLLEYHTSLYDHVKKMVTDVRPANLKHMPGTFITPTKAIGYGANYLVIREPIIHPPQDSSMIAETLKIVKEVSVALTSRSRVISAGSEKTPIRKAPSCPVQKPIHEIIKTEKNPLGKSMIPPEKKRHKIAFLSL